MPRKNSIRLSGYDYASSGKYYITSCTKHRKQIFGEVVNGTMILNWNGYCVLLAWYDLPDHYPHVRLDEFTVMPDHIHGIIHLLDVGDATAMTTQIPTIATLPANTALERSMVPDIPRQRKLNNRRRPNPHRADLHEIVRALKSFSAKRINERLQTPCVPVWQRRYHDHIIRNDHDLQRIREYIRNNPVRWTSHVGAGLVNPPIQ